MLVHAIKPTKRWSRIARSVEAPKHSTSVSRECGVLTTQKPTPSSAKYGWMHGMTQRRKNRSGHITENGADPAGLRFLTERSAVRSCTYREEPNMESPLIGKHVLVRTYSAGVHIGTLAAKDGENVLLTDARRLWKWSGAFTLSEVATVGINPKQSRMAVAVPMIELTNANEIIPTTEAARATFEKCHE